MKLYSYYRSSASYRVRIALALKGITYETIPVHLLKAGGMQHKPDYQAINPMSLVPSLVSDEGHLPESLAILHYLDAHHPTPALFAQPTFERAQQEAIALHIIAGIQPLMNLRTLQQLEKQFGADDSAKKAWIAHWVHLGFNAIEQSLGQKTGPFAWGENPSVIDCCLVPQVYAAKRFEVDLKAYPRITAIDTHCATQTAFQAAHPETQPDYPG